MAHNRDLALTLRLLCRLYGANRAFIIDPDNENPLLCFALKEVRDCCMGLFWSRSGYAGSPGARTKLIEGGPFKPFFGLSGEHLQGRRTWRLWLTLLGIAGFFLISASIQMMH